ncbi:MAG TPA: VanW family protein [Chloroflexota bacterium]|nr:VanW family protein [Chloroflexota bacterium]
MAQRESEQRPETGWDAAWEPAGRPGRAAGAWRGAPLGALAGFAAVLLLAGAALGGYQVAFAGRAYPGVEALGVDLGGRTRDEAVAALAAQADTVLAAPVTVQAAETRHAATWRDLGLRLAPEALADRALAVGRSGNPLRRLAAQYTAATRHYAVDAALAFDDAALDAYLQGVAQEVDRPARDAKLLVQPDATIAYTPSQVGRQLDVAAAAARVREAQRAGASEVALPVAETPPQTPDALRTEARDTATRLLAQPLVLRYEDREWTVTPRELVDWLQFDGGPGQPLTARVDDAAVRKRVAALAKEIDQPASNARLDWNGGNLQVTRAAAAGRQLDQAATQQAILAHLTTDDHTVTLPVQVAAPAVTGDNLAALGITEQIEESRTSFAGSVPEKAHNIRLAAERLNGVVVPPGGTFSFNREVGPTTLETGYQWGFGITSGADGLHTVPSVAGGICQVATTLFQAFFWGGYRLEERHWHLYWIPAYTSRDVVGLDATVDEDANLDMQFVNTTPHAVLIQASTDADSVTFRLYSTKPDWKVEVAPAQITDRVPADPTPVVEEDATLPAGRRIAVEAAREGFTVVVTRTVTEDGDVRTLPLKSVYQPSRNVTLVGTGGAPAAGGSAQNRPVGDGDRE